MRSGDCVIVRGAGEPGEVEMDAVGPVSSTGSVPCTELREGVAWATDVVVAGASAEPSLAAVGTAKTEAKSLSAACDLPTTPFLKLLGGDTECPLQVCLLSRSSVSTHFLSRSRGAALLFPQSPG